MSKTTSVLLLLLLLTVSECSKNVKENLLEGLQKVVSYVGENYKSMNVDGLFGLVLAEVHLGSISNLDLQDRKKIEQMVRNLNKTVEKAKPFIKQTEISKLVETKLLRPDVWTKEIVFRPGRVNSQLVKRLSHINQIRAYLRYLASSQLDEDFSDSCFAELLSTRHVSPTSNTCAISYSCEKVMVDEDYVDPAYGVSHRLLFLQVARSQKCNINIEMLNKAIEKYCSFMFWEANKNAKFGFIEELDDLLLEQITLCGYEGVTEFLSNDFTEHVLEIQTEQGCFKTPAPEENERRTRREANLMEDGCNDHTTGLGASTLSLMLRYVCST